MKLAECINCNRKFGKKGFKSKTIQGDKVLVCINCGYYNSPLIFNK